MTQRISKAKLIELRKSHALGCKIKYCVIVGCYTWDLLAKVWVTVAPTLILYGVMSPELVAKLSPVFMTGFATDYFAKFVHLKSTKLRKSSLYQKIVRKGGKK